MDKPTSYRIKSSYVPGSGDKGRSNMKQRIRIPKVNLISNVYMASENLLLSIGKLLMHHNKASKNARFIPGFLRKPLSNFVPTNPYNTKELIDLTCWLEQGVFSLQSFCYCEGDSERHRWPTEVYRYIHKITKKWQKDAGSLEFQIFSTHENLQLINEVRVNIRALEVEYRRWANSLSHEIMKRETIQQLEFHAKVLNRLSSFYWVALQKERASLNLDPNYWVSSAPDFDLVN